MPRLWNETIEAHRHAVREAILDTTWALATEHGLTSVKMSQIAKDTGIGRATLYKYFADVEAILFAWHQRHVAGHLDHLAELRDQPGDAGERLEAVLEAYALICHHREHHGTELAALLHRGEHVARAQQQLIDLIRDLLTEVAEAGKLRDDVAPDELASYCLHALTAASSLPSEAAVRRLVTVTLAGLRPALTCPDGEGRNPIRMPDGALLTVPRARLELAAPDHRLAPEGDGSTADWFVNELAAWAGSELSVGSFVPGSFPAVARVLHPWREHGVPGDRPVRWREVADCGGFHTLRELAATRGPRGGLEVAGYGDHQGAGQLDVETARVLVELLQAATTTPDDVFFAVWTGWGDVPPQRFPGAALIDAPGREHFLLRGPLPGALVPVAVSGDRPVSGLWWPADRAWFVATEIDFEWTFVAGTEDLIDRLAVHPQLEATRTSPDSVANLPDEDA